MSSLGDIPFKRISQLSTGNFFSPSSSPPPHFTCCRVGCFITIKTKELLMYLLGVLRQEKYSAWLRLQKRRAEGSISSVFGEDTAVLMIRSVQAGLAPLHPFFLHLFSSCFKHSLGCLSTQSAYSFEISMDYYHIYSPRSSSNVVILIRLFSCKSVLPTGITA